MKNKTTMKIINEMKKDKYLRIKVLILYFENETDYIERNPDGVVCSLTDFIDAHGDCLKCLERFYKKEWEC